MLKPWEVGECLGQGTHDIWCRRTPDAPWCLQLMLLDLEDDNWVFRRSNRVGGPISEMGRHTDSGIPYLKPEVQLLYKAKPPIFDKDQADLETALPLMDAAAKAWLLRGIHKRFPHGHEWVAELEETLRRF